MNKKELLEDLKKKNLESEKTLDHLFKERVKKINRYLSSYLYSLLGISTTGSVLALAAFFTPWLPSVATALTAFFTTVISALALPLLITIPIITVTLLLSPIAAFLWKKHQVNSELNNSFEKLKKSLDSLEKIKGQFNAEITEITEITEIKMRQALCIHEFLTTQKAEANYDKIYDKIDELFVKCGISAEWIYAVDVVLKNGMIPVSQEGLDNRINSSEDQIDGDDPRMDQVTGVDKFLLEKKLDINILNSISFLDTSKREDFSQDKAQASTSTTHYDFWRHTSHEEKSPENSLSAPKYSL